MCFNFLIKIIQAHALSKSLQPVNMLYIYILIVSYLNLRLINNYIHGGEQFYYYVSSITY